MTEDARGRKQGRAVVSAPAPPQVRLRWLLSALGLLFVAAFCCGYLALCLLFLQGQWQLLYHPSQTVAMTPASVGLAFDPVLFGADEAGLTRLSGWWVPAPTPNKTAATVLYLHGGDGSLADAVGAIKRLHALGCAVFAIDYRGFGASRTEHPGEAHMVEDARTALSYLEETRHLAPGAILVWGRGIGATIAAEAVGGAGNRERLVLEEPNPPAIELLRADGRTSLLPMRMLLHDRLDIAPILAHNSAARLFLASPQGGAAQAFTRHLYDQAPNPKSFAMSNDVPEIERFLALP